MGCFGSLIVVSSSILCNVLYYIVEWFSLSRGRRHGWPNHVKTLCTVCVIVLSLCSWSNIVGTTIPSSNSSFFFFLFFYFIHLDLYTKVLVCVITIDWKESSQINLHHTYFYTLSRICMHQFFPSPWSTHKLVILDSF